MADKEKENKCCCECGCECGAETTEDAEATVLETDEETVAIIEKLAAEKEEYLNALKRERADFENYKKRNADLVARTHNEGVADTVKAILPVLDNLERAVASAADDESPLKTGVELVLRSFLDALKALGVEEISTDGAFDPNFHNAVMQVEAEEGEESGMVKEVFQKGYILKGKVLRYSMVKVTQ